jgi:cytochrome b involved in lipid metabolism
MDKKYKPLFLILLIIFISGCTENFSKNGNTLNNTQVNIYEEKYSKNETENSLIKGFIFEEISKHNTENDCWLIIHGKVYDVTNYVSSHPGGKTIIEGCGKDATNLFETRPMGSGTSHSKKAREKLENFYIGEFINRTN